MTYLIGKDLPTAPAGERFRKLLDRPGILQIPGAYCGLAAIQAKLAQFEAVYLSGAAMSALGSRTSPFVARENLISFPVERERAIAMHVPIARMVMLSPLRSRPHASTRSEKHRLKITIAAPVPPSSRKAKWDICLRATTIAVRHPRAIASMPPR